jgi:hypothetical protein
MQFGLMVQSTFTNPGWTDVELKNIVIDIIYRKTNYALSQYEELRKIINAAADFNKVALVLEKK